MSYVTRRLRPPRATVVACLVAAALIGAPAPSFAVEKSEAQLQNEFGVKVAQLGSWNEAAFRFERALKADGRNARVYNNLAVAREILGEPQAAREAYEAALALAPDDKRIRANYDRFMGHYKATEKPTDAP